MFTVHRSPNPWFTVHRSPTTDEDFVCCSFQLLKNVVDSILIRFDRTSTFYRRSALKWEAGPWMIYLIPGFMWLRSPSHQVCKSQSTRRNTQSLKSHCLLTQACHSHPLRSHHLKTLELLARKVQMRYYLVIHLSEATIRTTLFARPMQFIP